MNKVLKLLIWPVALAPVVYLAVVWNSLPETVPVHFDLHGTPDRYGNKTELLVILCVMTLFIPGIYFLLSNIYRIDPKKFAAENKRRLERIGFATAIFLSGVSCFVIYSTIHNGFEPGVKYILAGIGLLFCFIGNYMYNIKPNYFAGIRVPWTLNDEDNWRKTHLLAGKLWFVGGLLIAIITILLPNSAALIAFLVLTISLVIIPIVYSYRLYKKTRVTKLHSN